MHVISSDSSFVIACFCLFGLVSEIHLDRHSLESVCTSRNMTHLMRSLFFIVANYQISLRACHIPGPRMGRLMPSCEIIFHALLISLLQAADPTPSRVPELLVSLLVTEKSDWTLTAWSQLFRNCFQQEWQPPL